MTTPLPWRSNGVRQNNAQRPSEIRTRPCRYFQRTGSCDFGSSCRFSHDLDHVNRSSSVKDDRHTERDEYYRDWKRLLGNRSNTNERYHIQRLWSGAIQILNDQNRENQQMLVKDLVDDRYSGLAYIRSTMEMRFSPITTFESLIAESFLAVVTHPALLDCLSVDTYVGTVYNFISGVNGTRAVPFFTSLCVSIVDQYLEDEEERGVSGVGESFQKLLVVLRELLRRERRFSFNEDISKLFDSMEQISTLLESDEDRPEYRWRSVQVNQLRKTAHMSTDLLTSADEVVEPYHAPLVSAISTYLVDIVLPGNNHDNDHLDIRQIKVLPTAKEISSNIPDFLPSTDFREPHFLEDPVQRYLDTHFRLLRHDIFDPLKEVLSRLMLSFNDGTLPLRASRGDLNAHVYRKASIRHLSVHPKRGFEAHVSFSQPSQLQNKSRSDQRTWWENSKRLESGGIVCFLSSARGQAEPLLLIVSEKNTIPTEKHSLISERHLSTITTQLATVLPGEFQLLTRIYHEKAEGLLVDIPGLIPATFKPILRNLQEMMKQGELPFRQWIVPNPGNAHEHAGMPPPQYARSPGFTFPLKSIVHNEHPPFVIPVTASPEDMSFVDEVHRRTGLDHGQCQALIAALTREFALIQGPPGTGKSYLGVKLLRVLLDCKVKGNLGPIIVM